MDHEEARTVREKQWGTVLKQVSVCTMIVLLGVTAGTSAWCMNRDANSDALALCLQSNSATECASLFDNVSVEVTE